MAKLSDVNRVKNIQFSTAYFFLEISNFGAYISYTVSDRDLFFARHRLIVSAIIVRFAQNENSVTCLHQLPHQN